MDDLKQQRGEALRQARRQAGLSARKLADRINDRTPGSDLTDNAIYAYESGRVLLGREAAERIAEVLRIPLGGLLAGDPDFAGETLGCTPEPAELPGPVGDARCRRLHPRVIDLLQTAVTLRRMLAVERFELAGPGGFLHAFELLQQDGRRLLDHPDAAAAVQAISSPAQAALEQTHATAAELLIIARDGYRDLRQAAQAGSCAAEARRLADALTPSLDQLHELEGTLLRLAGLKPRWVEPAESAAPGRATHARGATLPA